MSITLFCLIKGNTTASAFEVDIEKDKSISHVKKDIKAEKQNDFAGIDADKLRLWKKEISDDQDDLLSNLSLEDKDELLATKKISKYFPDSLPEEHIHVIVEPPETTATSSQEVLELREKLALLQALLNKSTHGMYKIVGRETS
jgi:hypothetical protein